MKCWCCGDRFIVRQYFAGMTIGGRRLCWITGAAANASRYGRAAFLETLERGSNQETWQR